MELLPHIKIEEDLVRQVKLRKKECGYRLIYIKDKETNNVVSVCGFTILHSLNKGKILSIEDICTLPFARGNIIVTFMKICK